MLKVTVAPTQFYQDEVGVELTFTITLNGEPVDMTYAEVTLEVDGNPNSPFDLNPTALGVASYVTQVGDFSANGAPTWQYAAHVKFISDIADETFLSDEFSIYVVLKPTLTL